MRVIKRKSTIAVLVLIFCFFLVHIVQAVTAEPGTEQDPLVTKSYVDEQIEEALSGVTSSDRSAGSSDSGTASDAKVERLSEMVNDLTTLVAELNSKIVKLEEEKETGSQSEGFEVVKLTKGQKLYTGSGAEIVVRAGKAKGIKGEFGGLSDVTVGEATDIGTGDDVPLNHLLLSSRDDYRGISADTEVWLIIRGSYNIK